jgi:hypothetical protein
MTNEEERFIPTPEQPQPAAPAEGEALVVTDDPVRLEGEGYTVSKWATVDNYECDDCPFATLDLPIMLEHRKQRHTNQPEQPAEPQQRKRPRYMRRD